MIVTLPGWVSGHRPRHARHSTAGWCVRMDWPDATHSLIGFATTPTAAAAGLPGLRAYWAHGPLRPVAYVVVEISRHDWRIHARRHGCASPDCPTGPSPTDTPPTGGSR